MRRPKTSTTARPYGRSVPRAAGKIKKRLGERLVLPQYAEEIPIPHPEIPPEGFSRLKDDAGGLNVRRPRRAKVPKGKKAY